MRGRAGVGWASWEAASALLPGATAQTPAALQARNLTLRRAPPLDALPALAAAEAAAASAAPPLPPWDPAAVLEQLGGRDAVLPDILLQARAGLGVSHCMNAC